MKARIAGSDARGVVRVPGSKSYTIRAAMCAAMADGESTIGGALESDDSAAVLDCLSRLGTGVREVDGTLRLRGGVLRAAVEPLWCRESGATFRFMAALAATVPGVTRLRCAPSLARRPMQPLLDALRRLGAAVDFDVMTGTLVVRGERRRSGHAVIRGDVSSQFLSALLLSGPRYGDGLRMELSSPLVSERYAAMTIDCMRRFGAEVVVSDGGYVYDVSGPYRPTRYVVEGDWSGAAALLALGAACGEVTAVGLYPDSLQADAAMIDLLERMGAMVECGDGRVTVSRAALVACDARLSEAIDLLPVVCALGAVAHGTTVLTGIARARDKESDRVAAMAEGLAHLGVPVDVTENEMQIRGGVAHGGEVSSAGDHRIAMAFGVLGAAVGDVVIDGAECVSKTYPAFWQALSDLGVEVMLSE